MPLSASGLGFGPTEGGAWLLLFAGLALFGLLLGLLGQARARRAEARAAGAEHRLKVTAESLETAPWGVFQWPVDGEGEVETGRGSRRLAVILDLPTGSDSDWAAVIGGFGERARADLKRHVETLRDTGEGFSLELDHAASGRRLSLSGLRVVDWAGDLGDSDDPDAPSEPPPLADLLWVGDITEVHRDGAARARALAASRDRAGRLDGLLDALPLPVWQRDADLALVYCNRAYAQAVGAPDPAAVVADGRELAEGAEARRARALAAAARAGGGTHGGTFSVVMGGDRRRLAITETALDLPADDGNEDRLTVGLGIDVTDREEADALLRRHQAAHAQVLERLGTALAIFDAETRLVFANAAFARLFTLDPEWLAEGPGYGDLLETLRERRRLPEVADFKAFREGELARFANLLEPREEVQHLPDGTTLRRVVAPHPLGGLLLLLEDVTDTLALERNLNTQIAVQRETLDHLDQALAVIGPDRRLTLSNPAFTSLWGLDEGERAGIPAVRLGQRLAERLDPESAAQIGPLLEAPAPGAGRRVRLGDGEGRVVDGLAVGLPDGGTLLSFRDVTDAAEVERVLRQRAHVLAEANRLKSDFIADVSFELRTPLTTVAGFADVLGGGYYGELNSRQKEYATGIRDTALKLGQLISDIADLATIEAGQARLDLDSFDIHALLMAVAGLHRESLNRRRITLNFDCPPDIGRMVGDQARLKQALYHLLGNAIRFSSPGQGVILAAQRSEMDGADWIAFTVADQGSGIPEADQNAVFDPFRKAHGSPHGPNHPEGGGTGLGLPLVKRFIDLHGGTLDLTSVPDEGTTVTCHLPTNPTLPAD
ncbi:sensor histidine kinase [Roseospirillum parvum]|uniref:histidine kinase n=1 Tax=Roseospirillum parvum TaxID=83401 RepID=A0A1G8AW54_9PROT|nr:PAS domain-containing sensor histidine kinase [Roseospirillum parvum]SDH25181.1 PAS domain-containing protein [Roseospirillum parvum]